MSPECLNGQYSQGCIKDASVIEGILGPLSEGNVPSTLMKEYEECVVTFNLNIE